jgi:hypothetical protein
MALPKVEIPPDQDNFSLTDEADVLTVRLDGGASRYRLDKTGSTSRCTVQWTTDRDGYTYLRGFYRTVKNGALPFLIDLYYDESILTEHQAYFIPGSFKLARQYGYTFVVAAELEVYPPAA